MKKINFKSYINKYLVIYISTLITIIVFNILLKFGEKLEIGLLNTLIFIVFIELYISFLILIGYIVFLDLILKIKLKNIEISILIILSLLSYNLIPKDLLLNIDINITRNLSAILPITSFLIYGLFIKYYTNRRLK